MNYRMLSVKELRVEAERDPRYGTEPLFTELVARLRNEKRWLDSAETVVMKPVDFAEVEQRIGAFFQQGSDTRRVR